MMPFIDPLFTGCPTYLDVALVPVDVLIAQRRKYFYDFEISCLAKQWKMQKPSSENNVVLSPELVCYVSFHRTTH